MSRFRLILTVCLCGGIVFGAAQNSSESGASDNRGGVENRRQDDRSDVNWQSSPEVPQILKRAIQAQKNLHFVGRLVRQFEKGPLHEKHEEIVTRDGARTRIEFPAGSKYAGQLIVEGPSEWRYYQPEKNTIFVRPPRREENFQRLVGIARRAARKRLQLTLGPSEVVAGVSTQQVVVKDPYNTIVERLYIDPTSGILLKRIVYSVLGNQTGYFEFNQINTHPGVLDSSLFALNRPGAKVVTPADLLRTTAVQNGFEPVLFPAAAGFRLESSRVTTADHDPVLVESFSSERGRLTLFELKSAVSPARLKAMARDQMQVYSWQRGGKWFVLIGPKSTPALAQQAQSLYTETSATP